MSFGKQSSEQRSSTGLNPGERVWFSNRAPGAYRDVENLSTEAYNDPGGLAYQGVVDQLLPMGRYGQSQGADQGIMQLGREAFTGASGNRAQRGFNTPHSLDGVIGDAMRMASSQLIPQSNAFAMQRAQMAPALRQAAFGYGMTPMQTMQQLLTGSSQSGGTSSGFQFDSQIGQMANALGKGSMSDRRLKSNIVRIGTHRLGIGWYEYDIQDRHEEGVMAQELLDVMPEAVHMHEDGYYRVDYNLIGRVG